MHRVLLLLVMTAACGQPPAAILANKTDETSASSARRLAERFAPLVMLHPQEPYLPMSLEAYFPHLTEPKDDAFFRSSRGDFEHGQVAATVAHVSADQTLLQYWFFYPKNGCQGARAIYKPDADQLFAMCDLAIHEGDWEHLTLRLKDGAITQVFFSEHQNGVWLEAKDVEFSGEHPVAYAALNSHANYPHAVAFASDTTIANPLLDALTGLVSLEIGDIVAGTPATEIAWDTRLNLLVWEADPPTNYSTYLGSWGLTIDARQVGPITAVPAWLSDLLRVGSEVAFLVVPRLQDLSNGEPPPSPWGRDSWRDFDSPLATSAP